MLSIMMSFFNARIRKLPIAVFTVLMLFAVDGYASHFRYGTMSWTSDNPNNPLEVTFNITEAWRSDFIDVLFFENGFGGSFNTGSNRTTIGSFTDPGGNSYTVFNSSITQTYPTAGTFNPHASLCCRVGGLEGGASGAPYRIGAEVDLSPPFTITGSPEIGRAHV